MAAISFTRKTYTDTASSGSGLVAADMNKIEKAIVDLNTAVTSLQDSVSQYKIIYDTDTWHIYTISNIIFIYCYGVKIGNGSWANATCPHTLASAYRPKRRIVVPTVVENGGSWTGVIIVETTGKITVSNYGSSGSADNRCGMISYPIMTYMGTAYTTN